MEKKTCKDCEHFWQHYIFDQNRYYAANCGHCVYPGLKDRRPDAKICTHFQQAAGRKEPCGKREWPLQIMINCFGCEIGSGIPQSSGSKGCVSAFGPDGDEKSGNS